MAQYHAVSKDFDLFAFHNVAALSLISLCSAAYIGRTLYKASERTRRAHTAKLAEIELVEQADAGKEGPCALCEQRSRRHSTSVPVSAGSPSLGGNPSASPTPAKGRKRDRKGKGPATSVTTSASASPARDPQPSSTRTVGVQTDPLPLPAPYPPEDVLAFVRASRSVESTSGTRSDDDIDVSPSLHRGRSTNKAGDRASDDARPPSSLMPSTSAIGAPSESGRSVSSTLSEASTSTSSSTSAIRGRRSSSGATTMSMGPETVTLSDEKGFMTPPPSGRKARKQQQSLPRREVVGMPKPPAPVSKSPQSVIKPLPSISKADKSDAYWTQDPVASSSGTSMPPTPAASAPASTSKAPRLPLAVNVTTANAGPTKAPVPSPRPPLEPRRSSLAVDQRVGLMHPNATLSPVPVAAPLPRMNGSAPGPHSTYTFSPPASPSPMRMHHPQLPTTSPAPFHAPLPNGNGLPPPPSPSFIGRAPPAYSTNDAMAHAAQQAYAIAQQQMYLVAQQQRLQQQSMVYNNNGGGGYLHYNVHPAHVSAPQAMASPSMSYMGGPAPHQPPMPSPALGVGNLSRQTSFDVSGAAGGMSSSGSIGTGDLSRTELDKLREQVGQLQRKSKRAEIENERKGKELEIAKWRLQCVETDRKTDDLQTQEAICFFVEKAEAAERKVKDLETKLGITHEASDSEQPVAETSNFTSRPTTPAAIAGLERLDMTSLGRATSPAPSSAMSPRSRYSSPSVLSPTMGGPPRRRRSRKSPRIGGPSSTRAGFDSPIERENGGSTGGYDSDDDDDLVILLSSPAMTASTSTSGTMTHHPLATLAQDKPALLQLPPSVSGPFGLGIGSAASSEAGDDEAETEPEDEASAEEPTHDADADEGQLTAPVVMDVRIQPATPDGTEPGVTSPQQMPGLPSLTSTSLEETLA